MTTVSEQPEQLTACIVKGAIKNPNSHDNLVTMFRASAASHGYQVAMNVDGRTLTYQELDGQSERLAGQLRSLGAEPGSAIGFLLDRSVPVPLGLLGILKAGCAYLPLDVENAPERLQIIAKSARASIILAPEHLLSRAHLLFPEACKCALEQIPDDEVPSEMQDIGADDLAIILYTSGSTGIPKGVELDHRAFVSYFQGIKNKLGVSPGDVSFGIAPFSFDLSLQEMFLALLFGGEYRLIGRTQASDGFQLGPLLRTEERAYLTATPATLRLLWETNWEGAPNLTILSGGETLHANLAHYAQQRAKRVFNIYGPTEATIAITWHEVTGKETRIPLGDPVSGCEVFIVNEEGQLVEPGEQGELFLAGPQLARGYRQRSDLTAERFVSLKLPDGRQVRSYRSGDLASWDGNGELHFHGRRDNQIKLRGQRIELDEIEVALVGHKSIHEALVCLKSFGENDDRLVAYFSSRVEPAPTTAELRQYLGKSLPSYMVPRHYEFRLELPKNDHDKINRKALNAEPWTLLRPEGPLASETQAQSLTTTEGRLLAIWHTLPGFLRCSIDDNYFDLGGHSLLAARLFQRINAEFGTKLPVSTLLRAKTIRQIAELIDEQQHQTQWSSLVAIRKGNGREPVFLIHAIGGNLLSFRKLIAALPEDVPLYGFQAHGVLPEIPPHESIPDMASEYARLVREVCGGEPCVLIGYSAGGAVILEMARQLKASGQAVKGLVILDSVFHESGAMQSVQRFEQLTLSVCSGGKKLVRKLWGGRRHRGQAGTNGGGVAGSDWKNPIRLVIMEFYLAARQLPVFRGLVSNRFPNSFVAALRRYRATPLPEECPAILFRAIDESRPKTITLSLGWDGLVSPLSVREAPCDHWKLVESPYVQEVADEVQMIRSLAERPSDLTSQPVTQALLS